MACVQIDNEDELMAVMKSVGPDVEMKRVDLALIDTFEQLRIIADTEVLVRICAFVTCLACE